MLLKAKDTRKSLRGCALRARHHKSNGNSPRSWIAGQLQADERG
jgi:hypothetical protein